jgi:hypothetical protein
VVGSETSRLTAEVLSSSDELWLQADAQPATATP